MKNLKYFVLICFGMILSGVALLANPLHLDRGESVTLISDGTGTILGVEYDATWTSGAWRDLANQSETYNDIDLLRGTYSYSMEIQRRGNRNGKVNLRITTVYKGGSNVPVCTANHLAPDQTHTGVITVRDYHNKEKGSYAGYGKLKVKVSRSSIVNTNVRYRITLTRTSSSFPSLDNFGDPSSDGDDDCDYRNLLTPKVGTVYAGTKGTKTAFRPACKSWALVEVRKTGGKAKTELKIYSANTPTGTGTLLQTIQYAKKANNSTQTFRFDNVDGKFLRAEFKNQSTGYKFKYRVEIYQ